MTRTQDFNVAASGVAGVSTSDYAETNQWMALFPDPDELGNSRTYNVFRGTTQNYIDLYNDSIFALSIPQGTEADERVGATINVLKDSWRFKIFLNLYNPADSTEVLSANQQLPMPRTVKFRLVGVFQNVLLEPGDIGYLPSEFFEDTGSINSRLKRGDAQGYEVIYDKTKTLALNNWAKENGNRISGPNEIYFGCSKAYQRSWSIVSGLAPAVHGGKEDGCITGVEIATNRAPGSGAVSVDTIYGGTAKGQILWYLFVEDNTVYHDTLNDGYWYYPQWGYTMQVKRRTYWNDP